MAVLFLWFDVPSRWSNGLVLTVQDSHSTSEQRSENEGKETKEEREKEGERERSKRDRMVRKG